MKKNIVLIGMPGAGKSTVGVLLSKALNYDFLDTDILIQQKVGQKLYEIIRDQGMDAFLAIENKTLQQIDVSGTVVATGGSAIFGEDAMIHLAKNGKIVYIKLSCDEIIRRVRNIKTRGIAMKKGKTLEDVYYERTPLYEKYADVVVECDDTTIETCVQRIMEACKLCV
ncbi:MAG: shikimate kinase [Eubacteriales bacterium]|nr:shikimate kinase [Lachnospiraceae bacterium]MDO5126835.1 shikimate kinase [Eubacteriales bacterium]